MRADELYEAALAVLGEEEYSCEDYNHLRFRIINQVVSMFLSTQATIDLSYGRKPAKGFIPIEKDSDTIPLDDAFARDAAVPMVAALLVQERDRDKANVLSELAQREREKYSMVGFRDIVDVY